jgi:hypothetical protein
MRFDQARHSVPKRTGSGIARECGVPNAYGLPDVELISCLVGRRCDSGIN